MSAMFASPPKIPAPPPIKPIPGNTAAQMQAAQAGRRQGLQAAFLGGGGQASAAQTGGAHTLTGQ